jgi:hypothetical protein
MKSHKIKVFGRGSDVANMKGCSMQNSVLALLIVVALGCYTGGCANPPVESDTQFVHTSKEWLNATLLSVMRKSPTVKYCVLKTSAPHPVLGFGSAATDSDIEQFTADFLWALGAWGNVARALPKWDGPRQGIYVSDCENPDVVASIQSRNSGWFRVEDYISKRKKTTFRKIPESFAIVFSAGSFPNQVHSKSTDAAFLMSIFNPMPGQAKPSVAEMKKNILLHEVGHLMGLGDVYLLDDFQNEYEIIPPSVMQGGQGYENGVFAQMPTQDDEFGLASVLNYLQGLPLSCPKGYVSRSLSAQERTKFSISCQLDASLSKSARQDRVSAAYPSDSRVHKPTPNLPSGP